MVLDSEQEAALPSFIHGNSAKWIFSSYASHAQTLNYKFRCGSLWLWAAPQDQVWLTLQWQLFENNTVLLSSCLLFSWSSRSDWWLVLHLTLSLNEQFDILGNGELETNTTFIYTKNEDLFHTLLVHIHFSHRRCWKLGLNSGLTWNSPASIIWTKD